MKNKIITYMGLGVIVLLFFGTFAMGAMNGMATKDNNKDVDTQSGETYYEMQARMHTDQQATSNTQVKSSNSIDLAKYRQAPIPEDCRLADYDDDVYAWAEHLSHHGDTKFCLEYYKDIN